MDLPELWFLGKLSGYRGEPSPFLRERWHPPETQYWKQRGQALHQA